MRSMTDAVIDGLGGDVAARVTRLAPARAHTEREPRAAFHPLMIRGIAIATVFVYIMDPVVRQRTTRTAPSQPRT